MLIFVGLGYSAPKCNYGFDTLVHVSGLKAWRVQVGVYVSGVGFRVHGALKGEMRGLLYGFQRFHNASFRVLLRALYWFP